MVYVGYKSVGLSEEIYHKLNARRAEFEIELKKYVSFGECVRLLVEKHESKVSH